MPNFEQISQSTAEIVLLQVPKSKWSPYFNFTSGFYSDLSKSSPCDSALTYQILSKLDYRRRIYDVISVLQVGGHSVANLLPVFGLAMFDF